MDLGPASWTLQQFFRDPSSSFKFALVQESPRGRNVLGQSRVGGEHSKHGFPAVKQTEVKFPSFRRVPIGSDPSSVHRADSNRGDD